MMKCIVCEEPLEKALFGKIGGIKVSLCKKHFDECSSCEKENHAMLITAFARMTERAF